MAFSPGKFFSPFQTSRSDFITKREITPQNFSESTNTHKNAGAFDVAFVGEPSRSEENFSEKCSKKKGRKKMKILASTGEAPTSRRGAAEVQG
jgi:hypothetical protein